MNRILITGAAGKIGSTLREGLRGRYAVLRLSDIAPLDPARAGEEIVRADLADLAEVEAAMQGVDCVVHLGAIAGEDTWDKILPNNVVGTWNVFEAARRQGVRRVIYASSHHAVGFYRRARFIDQMVYQVRTCERLGVKFPGPTRQSLPKWVVRATSAFHLIATSRTGPTWNAPAGLGGWDFSHDVN